jgi:hypothetical protein
MSVRISQGIKVVPESNFLLGQQTSLQREISFINGTTDISSAQGEIYILFLGSSGKTKRFFCIYWFRMIFTSK